jgi:hypothetical protein
LRAALSGIFARLTQGGGVIPDSRALRRASFRDDRRWRFPFIALATLCATSVLAAELPISGVYGDEMGCARLTMEPDAIDEPGGINVYADRIEGYEWGCAWAEVWPYPGDDRGFGVQGLCGGEGIPSLEQYIIELGFDDRTRMTVYAANGEPRWELTLCEGAAQQGGKG